MKSWKWNVLHHGFLASIIISAPFSPSHLTLACVFAIESMDLIIWPCRRQYLNYWTITIWCLHFCIFNNAAGFEIEAWLGNRRLAWRQQLGDRRLAWRQQLGDWSLAWKLKLVGKWGLCYEFSLFRSAKLKMDFHTFKILSHFRWTMGCWVVRR